MGFEYNTNVLGKKLERRDFFCFKNMNELTQILQKEQEQKQRIEEARKEAQEEIEKQRAILENSFNKMAILSVAEKGKISGKEEKEKEKIGEKLEVEFLSALKELESKKEKNIKKAVGYIVGEFIK